jgi:hypothetical protein
MSSTPSTHQNIEIARTAVQSVCDDLVSLRTMAETTPTEMMADSIASLLPQPVAADAITNARILATWLHTLATTLEDLTT